MYFLANKDETLHTFIKHCKKDQNEKCLTLVNFKSNHGGDFDKYAFNSCKWMPRVIRQFL